MDINQNTLKLTEVTIGDIFKDCLVRREEVENDKPLIDYTKAEGINTVSFFNTERLNSHKDTVEKLISQVRGIERGISFLNLSLDHKGNHTSKYQRHMDQLIQLGVASGILTYTVDRQCIDALPGYVPFIMLTDQMLDPQVINKHANSEKAKVNVLTK